MSNAAVSNSAIEARRGTAISRGVGVTTQIYAARAENAEIWDVEGRRYIDFTAGIAVVNTGHRHPKVIAAVKDQIDRFTHTCHQVVPYENYVRLAERLNQLVPGDFAKKTVFYFSIGSARYTVTLEPEWADATPAERFGMWKEMERTYLPWRDFGDVPHVTEGGFWQAQRHIYGMPFYYIDYVLAQICALQFWVKADTDRQAAMKDYVALCQRGGEAPFQDLVKSAGLTSPFEPGCLEDVLQKARDWLGAHG